MDSQLDQALAMAREHGWSVAIRGIVVEDKPGAVVEVMRGKESRTREFEGDWLVAQPEPEDAFAQAIQELIR